MRTPQFLPLTLCLALSFVLPLMAARAGDDPWPDIRAGVFADRDIAENDGTLALYAPEQAEDAALVPIAVHLPADIANRAKSLTLIIDRNPAPVAATFRFGDGFQAAADIGERKLMTRVRIDAFSRVRAVLETADGKLHMATKFVMGAGGCSAPASKDAEAALASLGRIQVKTIAEPARGERWREGVVMIRHPNFTGMQMDQVTRNYVPADFVQNVTITHDGKPVLSIEGNISLSENPAFDFWLKPSSAGVLRVNAEDSNGRKFERVWMVPAAS